MIEVLVLIIIIIIVFISKAARGVGSGRFSLSQANKRGDSVVKYDPHRCALVANYRSQDAGSSTASNSRNRGSSSEVAIVNRKQNHARTKFTSNKEGRFVLSARRCSDF